MSITPFFTALPCSKVGIASGPPTSLICTRPLPSLFACSTKRTKISPNVVLRGTNSTALSVVSCAAAMLPKSTSSAASAALRFAILVMSPPRFDATILASNRRRQVAGHRERVDHHLALAEAQRAPRLDDAVAVLADAEDLAAALVVGVHHHVVRPRQPVLAVAPLEHDVAHEAPLVVDLVDVDLEQRHYPVAQHALVLEVQPVAFHARLQVLARVDQVAAIVGEELRPVVQAVRVQA